ncbi:MAG: FAD-dependent oxidoreductase [Alistipes finegoldii]
MAARAAAGKGLRVMLIESRGYLGGNLTIGLPILATSDARATRLSKDCPSSSSTACVRGAPPANTVPASSM